MKNKEKFKRFAMAGVSFCFMLVIASYINYKYNPEREKDLGQTVYVNSNSDEVKIYEETQNVSNPKDETIANFRYDRDNMYSELSNNYTDVINNSNSSAETIAEYQGKLSELIEEKNQIIMIENMIKSKNIEDVVLIPTNSGKVNVILKVDELNEELVAQVMQIIVDQLDVNANDISIEKINM
ncbi:MAG: SpoIIIAH-like family protein [Clostridia bacterium]|nr:SpoIIIAH-like family protein [Clostridia bacterium]